jgi:hypothetical protein
VAFGREACRDILYRFPVIQQDFHRFPGVDHFQGKFDFNEICRTGDAAEI